MKTDPFHLDTALITNRTVTRRFREQDGEAFYKLFQENHSILEGVFPDWAASLKSQEDAERWVRSQLAAWLLEDSFSFAIWQKGPADMIGWIALENYRKDMADASLTGFMDHKNTNQGLMTEVLNSLLDFSFDDLGLEKVRLILASDNYAAQRLARKCNFAREGDLRIEGKKPTGERFDLVAFGFTRVDYEGELE